jgi:hypothetical protein
MSQAKKVKVVYITGAGRSGTTLLDQLLGEINGFVSIGEARWLWWAYLETEWQCGCKRPLNTCPFWTTVMRRLVDSGEVDPVLRHYLRLQQRTVRFHNLLRLAVQPVSGPKRWTELDEWISVMDRFYGIVSDEAGASVVVDSSKNSPEAILLRMLPNVDPYVIHLVRDPRGVANSWRHTAPMQPHADPSLTHEVRGPLASALYWLQKNLASELACRRVGPGRTHRIRYENLVAEPADALQKIAEFIGEPFEGVSFTDRSTVEFHANHTAWGNPSRFRVGSVALRPDERWRKSLSPRDRRATVATTLPLMLRYGYSVQSGANRRSKGTSELGGTTTSSSPPRH